ncbi:MAG: hypothetical protein ACYDAZ_09280 [Thermoplasmataceae archaeon]
MNTLHWNILILTLALSGAAHAQSNDWGSNANNSDSSANNMFGSRCHCGLSTKNNDSGDIPNQSNPAPPGGYGAGDPNGPGPYYGASNPGMHVPHPTTQDVFPQPIPMGGPGTDGSDSNGG